MEPLNAQRVREAKAIVALAFRNGPIETLHAGRICEHCHDRAEYSHITNAEMKTIMKSAVDRVYWLLTLRERRSTEYEKQLSYGDLFTAKWDDPEPIPKWRPSGKAAKK